MSSPTHDSAVPRDGSPPAVRPTALAVLAVLAVTACVLLLAACTGTGDGSTPASDAATTAGTGGTGTALYLVDSNTGDPGLAALPAGTLDGVRGTAVGAVPSDALRLRLDAIDPSLADSGYRYAAESYDAVVGLALAAVAAQTDAASSVASQLPAVTSGGAVCTEFAECRDALLRGDDIDYDGQSGTLRLQPDGNPAAAAVGIYRYDANNAVPGLAVPDTAAPVPTVTVGPSPVASAESSGPAVSTTPKPDSGPTAPDSPGAGDGVLTVATVLPTRGPLRALGGAETAGARLAVSDVNDAGGVLGRRVILVRAPGAAALVTGGVDAASNEAAALVSAGADAVLGGGAVSLTQPLVAPVTGAGALLVTPADPAATVASDAAAGLLFSLVAPADAEGSTVGGLVTDDGHRSVAVLVARSAYGNAFVAGAKPVLTAAGANVTVQRYDPTAARFGPPVRKVAAVGPDAVVLVGGEESAAVVQAMVAEGLAPNG